MHRLTLALCLLPAMGLLPAMAMAQPDAEKRAAVDKMLDALRTAPDERVAAMLEQKVTQLWLESGTPAVTLLMSRGLRDANAATQDEAVADFSDAIVLDPTLAEAWHQRAIARYKSGDTAGAVGDLRQTLKLEPRHFGAWRTLEHIAEAREDWKAAYDAWEHVLVIDPRTPNGDDHLKELKRKAFGDDA
jgi:tetratricopeptide (TPR) repeat protein